MARNRNRDLGIAPSVEDILVSMGCVNDGGDGLEVCICPQAVSSAHATI